MNDAERLARVIADDLLAGDWSRRSLARRLARLLAPGEPAERRELLDGLLATHVEPYPPRPDWIVRHLLGSELFRSIAAGSGASGGSLPAVRPPPRFAPVAALGGLEVPRLVTPGDLADWLEVPLPRLEWLADSRRRHGEADVPPLQHYRYQWLVKRNGTPRLIEAPKPELRAVQRRLLRGILDRLPPHGAAFGFVRGRSCREAAARHAGEAVVLTADLADFFPSTPVARVHAIFRSLGYPWTVARLLTGLCTTMTPAPVLAGEAAAAGLGWASRRAFASPHLAQGAPTSPALANLAARHLDVRLTGLAGRWEATYTRYADDLAFSGDRRLARRAGRFLACLARIAAEEGYLVNAGKTRVMGHGARQSVTGLVVNAHLNVPRDDYDRLKAILHNCVRHGPHGQNRAGHGDFRAHLTGRVAWVESVNPRRGARLRRLLEAIDWDRESHARRGHGSGGEARTEE